MDIVDKKMNKFKLNEKEKNFFRMVSKEIISHQEFQKRLDNKVFCHHGSTSLGEHIIGDAVEAYKIAIKKNKKNRRVDEKLTIIIALFHDLYELPWQNQERKTESFFNKHGFIHPIEAIVNAITWYPKYFEDEQDAEIIIDGVIHHMFPFPVRVFDNSNLDLNNLEKYNKIPENLKNIIKQSTYRNKIGKTSFSKSKYMEGNIVNEADKITTIGSDKLSPRAYVALVTGRNKELDEKKDV